MERPRLIKNIILVFCLLSVIPVNARKDSTLLVWGWPVDAFTVKAVVEGVQARLYTADSVLVGTAVPVRDTQYAENAYFQIKVPYRTATYVIRVTHPDYQTYVKKFTVKAGKKDNYLLGLLKLRRRPVRTRRLDEATVRATKVKFYVKGDTLVYNADAFNLAEGSMLDALIEQLPGAELKRDGQIFVRGKKVESLLLNGKDFFNGDNSVLLDNLPAYMVKDIKVYNEQSDRSKLLGREVDNGRYVMDVNLKRQYQIGWVSNAEAGGGSENRWLGRLFAMRFTPQSRITLFANANNTNESRKPGRNGEWQPTDIRGGLTTTRTGGLDYMVHDKEGRFELQGEVGASHTDHESDTRQVAENFLTSGNTFSYRWLTGKNENTSVSTSHRFRFKIQRDPNSALWDVHLYPRFKYQRTRGRSNNLEGEFRENPAAIAGLRDSLAQPELGAQLMRLLAHRVRSEQLAESRLLEGGADMTLSVLGWSLGGGVSASGHKSELHDLYRLDYGGSPQSVSDNRRRFRDTPADRFNAYAHVGRWWFFGTGGMFDPSVRYTYESQSQDQLLYRLEALEEMADAPLGALPSTREALMAGLDGANSYRLTQDRHDVDFSLRGRWDHDVRDSVSNQRLSRWRFTWEPRLTLRYDYLTYEGLSRRSAFRRILLPGLNLEFLRNTPGMKHQIEIKAGFSQTVPSQFTLLGLRFDDDPLNISEGNSGLRRTNVYSLRVDYMSDQWLMARRQMLSANLRFNAYQNAVATGYVYDTQTGVRTFRPENVNGNWSASANVSFSTPVDKHRRFTFKASLYDSYYHSVDLTGLDNALRTTRSVVRTNALHVPLSLEYRHDSWMLGTKADAWWHHAASSRAGFATVNGADLNYGVYGQVRLPWNLQLATDVTCYSRYGYTDGAMKGSDWVWNAQLSKTLLHGNLTFTLVGFDILGQLSNVSYSLNAQGRTESWSRAIPRYGMLRVAYRFNKQPKKR